MDQRWCLGNKKSNKVEKNLYSNQVAQRVFDQFSENVSIDDWVVWLTGWPNWRPLSEIQELVHEVNLIKKLATEAPPPPIAVAPTPPLPPSEALQIAEDKIEVDRKNWAARKPDVVSVNINSVKEDISSPKISKAISESEQANAGYSNRRKFKRITARFRCIIRSTSITFRTFTKDISLGGVALEDAIPMDLVGTQCQIYINSPGSMKNLKFKISLTERAIPKYFSFQEADEALIEELDQWLTGQQESMAA